MPEIKNPFSYKITGNFFAVEIQSEYIGYLSGENCDGNTTGKSDDDGIGYEFYDCAKTEYSEQYKNNSCQHCGNH